MKMITYEDFNRVELRSGIIVQAEVFERAKKPAYKVWVDFGDNFGIKKTSAQITTYKIDDLIGRQVVGCINLEPKNIAGFISEFLLVGFENDHKQICLVTVDPRVPAGQKLC